MGARGTMHQCSWPSHRPMLLFGDLEGSSGVPQIKKRVLC